MTRYIKRYEDGERINHWLIALLFLLAALSGLAFFHPSLYFFSAVLGGGPWARILHPFVGVLMFVAFVLLFAKFWRANRMTALDREWTRQAGPMLRGDKSHMPPVGKYNAGQKIVFWISAICLLVLLLTGFVFWRPYFAPAFPILLVRVAVLLHSVAALVLILAIIVHVYAAIWVRGTFRAMTRGTVSEGWARQNHPLWHQDMTGGR